MANVTVRIATPEDKEAVLRMNKTVYQGRDYLPAYYDYFMTSPDVIPVVVLYEGEIIAFDLGHIIDNGETACYRAGRTNPNFEGKGYIKQLMVYLRESCSNRGVKRGVFTVADSYPYLTNPSFRMVNTFIASKSFPIYFVAGQGLKFTTEDISHAVRLSAVSDMNLSLSFKSKSTREYIAPSGRMLVDLVPYDMTDYNIKSMQEPKEYKVIYSNIRVHGSLYSGLLSIGTVFPISNPQYKYMLDIFGSDKASLRTHLIKHLMRLKDKTNGVTAVLVYLPDDFDLDMVDALFDEFGINRKPYKSVKSPKLKSQQLYAFESSQQSESKM